MDASADSPSPPLVAGGSGASSTGGLARPAQHHGALARARAERHHDVTALGAAAERQLVAALGGQVTQHLEGVRQAGRAAHRGSCSEAALMALV